MAAPYAADMSKHLPAPKTFAPSREDVLSTLGFFFGDPAVPEKLKDYSEHHAMTYHFPDAFYGQNTKIRETLNNLILKSPQDWQTGVALPFVRIVGTSVEWDELRFDVRLLQRVPYEGVSRMQTSLRRRHRDRVVRRGIGMTIESDFYATEAGRQHFSDQLTSIRYCVQETCNFDTLFSYLTCGNYDFRYDLQKGLRPRRSVRMAMAHEVMFYAIVQKEGLGFDKCVEEAKARMARYNVTPNMLIVPPQLLLYMALAPTEKIKFSDAGPAGPERFEAGVAGYEARAFRGLGVFSSMPYEVSDDTDSVQMLQRSTQVGEYYRMQAPKMVNGDLPKHYMDIVIYDEEMDKHVHITAAEALKYALPNGTKVNTDIYKNGETKTPASIDAAAAGLGPDELPDQDAAGLTTALFTPATNGTAASSTTPATPATPAKVNWLPLEIIIARPFIEHLMMSAVMTVAGRDTGATLFGPADMQISANTSVKTIEGHYTCHTKSVITKPQNVLVLRDIMCSGYVAGGNTQFFGAKESQGGNDVESAKIRQSITERLSFAYDASGEYESMLAFLVPYGSTDRRDQVMSLSARLLPWEVTRDQSKWNSYFPGGPAGYEFYSKEFGLDSVHFGEDVRAAENMEFISQGSVNNALCFIGPHRVYSQWSSTYYELTPGQGHFGPDAIPGDARWRRGEAVSLEASRNAMVSLEAAAHSQLVFQKAA